jgi:hypothetical protein
MGLLRTLHPYWYNHIPVVDAIKEFSNAMGLPEEV